MTSASLSQAITLLQAGRNEEAVLMIRQIAATGDPDGLALLADMTWVGHLVDQDPARGRLLYEYAAARGHKASAIFATNLLASGVAGKRDWPLAIERLRAEADHVADRRDTLRVVEAMALDANGDPAALPSPEKLAERPDARIFRGLVSADECAHIMRVAEPLYSPSFVYDDQRQRVRDPIRTSDGAPIHWLVEDPAIHAINRRIAAVSATEYEDGEPLQALRYRPGEEYRPHFDFVTTAEVRRLWTALIYLNDDYEGGGTAFPRIGLEVRGRQGDVLLFGNAGPDGGPEPLAEHSGLPVQSGVKYLATRWIRERRWIP